MAYAHVEMATKGDLAQAEGRLISRMDSRIAASEGRMMTRIDGLAEIMMNGFEEIFGRLAEHDERFDRLGHRMDSLEQRMDSLEQRFSAFETRTDAKLDTIQQTLAKLLQISYNKTQ